MNVFTINLKHRIDRKEHMLREIDKLNCKSHEFIEAIIHDTPTVGCTLSHQYCIALAKSRDLEYVVILEDDVVFEKNVNDVLNNALNEVYKLDWNLLYLGGNIRGRAKYVSESLIQVDNVNTTHAYVIHRNFYDIVLSQTTDIVIDYQYRKLSANWPMYMCSPMVAYQMESYSDLQRRHVDYKNEMVNNYRRAIKQ